MDTGWHTTQMEKRDGHLVLVIEELYSGGGWSARVFLHADWHSAVRHTRVQHPTGMDAMDAVERVVAELGPVEPVLALLRAFARSPMYVRRTRRRAA